MRDRLNMEGVGGMREFYDPAGNRYGGMMQIKAVIYEALYFDMAQSRMKWAPNETRTHSCRFASLPFYPLHDQKCPI